MYEVTDIWGFIVALWEMRRGFAIGLPVFLLVFGLCVWLAKHTPQGRMQYGQ